MLDFQAIGAKIHMLRIKHEYKQEYLADLLYVSRQAVSRWELGQTLPSIDNLVQLCKLFNTSFEDLLCMNEEVQIDSNHLFHGHDREYILRGVLSGKIQVDIPAVFYQFSDPERLRILEDVKAGKLDVNRKDLLAKCTDAEMEFMRGDRNAYE